MPLTSSVNNSNRLPHMASSSHNASSGLPSPPGTPPQEQGPSPYTLGTRYVIKRHHPPAPSGRKYSNSRTRSNVPSDISQLDWCLAHPPEPGRTDVDDKRNIILEASIRIGEHSGAQVFRTNDGLVAKIYDPLYYPLFVSDWSSKRLDVTAEANHDYTIEAAAYSEFQGTPFQGSIMPEYHGSWTTEVASNVNGQQHLREVRMILLEHIVGTRMMDINPDKLKREEKENIMSKMIEADTDLRLAGLQHDDLEPRNVILSIPSQSASPKSDSLDHESFDAPGLRVCIIDYGRSCVARLVGKKLPEPGLFNPLFRWAGTDIYSQYGWLPPFEEAMDWMWEKWGDGGSDGKYVKVQRDLDDPLGDPIPYF